VTTERRTNGNGTGSKALTWAVGVLLCFLAIFGAIAGHFNAALSAQDTRIRCVENSQAAYSEGIKSIKDDIGEIKQTLNEMKKAK